MPRWISLLMLTLAAAFLPTSASASTTENITLTFAEPVQPALACPGFPDVSCGSGEIIPLGQATEIVVFGAGCAGTCDLRTIDLAGGSLILEETASNFTCPAGVCHRGPLEIVAADLTSVLIAGTGIYEGATGTLTGTAHFAISNARPAGAAIVTLSGTIHYDP
jgi:hypothetical protein